MAFPFEALEPYTGIRYNRTMISNVIETELDPRTVPLLRYVANRAGYDLYSNGHSYVLKLSDGRCVQFDFENTTVEPSPEMFDALLAAIRGIIEGF